MRPAGLMQRALFILISGSLHSLIGTLTYLLDALWDCFGVGLVSGGGGVGVLALLQ